MKAIKYLMILLLAVASFVSINCGEDEQQGKSVAKDEIYYCPMHPEVTSDKPGVCPICQMDLVLKGSGETMEEGEEGLSLSGRGQVLANVSTVTVKRENVSKTITAYSYLDFAEQNKKLVTARFNGRIEKLYVDKTGDYIRKGAPLFEIYSPDLVQAQNEYLIAMNGLQNITLLTSNNRTQDNNVLSSAKQKLLLYGLTEGQIAELEKNKKVNFTLTYYSPFSGTVIEKKVQEGMYVNEGSVVYDIADMSVLWNISEVFEGDLNIIKEGSRVLLRLNSYPGETFEGKVNLIYPVVNSDSRTIKIRSSFINKGNKLKPNMYGESIFSANLGESLVVPAEAVLFTGKRNIVWIKTGDKTFDAREVTLGAKIYDKYQVISGLNDGDIVASSGAYLIDSESQLKSGLSGAGHEGHGTTPAIKPDVENKKNSREDEHKGHSSVESSSSDIWNKVCPVLGGKVNPKVKTVSYNGKTIGFCCPGCDQDFKENPEKYLSNLSPDGKQFIGEKE